MVYDCVIIGGGAAGMSAAIHMKKSNINVAVVEHKKKLGSKLLVTGNGKCNYTNIRLDKNGFNSNDSSFVSDVITAHGSDAIIDFFKGIGVYPKDKNGYIYPYSETAASLCEALKNEISRLDIAVFMQTEAVDIIKENNLFTIKCTCPDGNMILRGTTILMAAGSKAAPHTGSDGTGYALLKKLGITVNKPLPALTALITDNRDIKEASGVRSTGKITVKIDDNDIHEDCGEIQYTDYGISGIPTFQVSRYAVKAVDEGKRVYAYIDMLPDFDFSEFSDIVKSEFKRDSRRTILELFQTFLNRKLVIMVGKSVGTDTNLKLSRAGEDMVISLTKAFKNFRLNITGFKEYDFCQACQGGVDLSKVDSKSMESTEVSGLFLAGEIMDVDGICGGYNLSWAWSSAYAASCGINKYLHNCKIS